MTNTTDTPAQTSELVLETGVSDEDRLREERVGITAWEDGVVGIRVEYAAEDTFTGTYASAPRAREIAYGILAAVRPSRDVRIDHAKHGTMIESASIENRQYLAGQASEVSPEHIAVEEDRDAVGTVYLDPTNGTMYRLRGWHTNIGSEEIMASYSTFLPGGASSSARVLPEGAVPVWSPAPIAGAVR